ncbi:MAG: lysophospholipid acyltransferase family protein [Planctomycetota bacterium]
MFHHLLLKFLFNAISVRPDLIALHHERIGDSAWRCSGHLRRVCTRNGRGVLGPDASDAELAAYGRSVIREFLRFVGDIAQAQDQPIDHILERVAEIHGRDHFESALERKRGVIVATCHLGNFEVGAAAIAERVPETHVLFHGDAHHGFEAMRAKLHRQLGITEAHIERGLDAWMQLRGALDRGGAVLIQADRCMPGQSGTPTPFLHGRLEMPDGPAKLARITGAPVLPIASCVAENGKIEIEIDRPVDPEQADGDDFDASLRCRLANFFSDIIARYPGQWHVLHAAFLESHDEVHRQAP